MMYILTIYIVMEIKVDEIRRLSKLAVTTLGSEFCNHKLVDRICLYDAERRPGLNSRLFALFDETFSHSDRPIDPVHCRNWGCRLLARGSPTWSHRTQARRKRYATSPRVTPRQSAERPPIGRYPSASFASKPSLQSCTLILGFQEAFGISP